MVLLSPAHLQAVTLVTGGLSSAVVLVDDDKYVACVNAPTLCSNEMHIGTY